MTNNQLYKFFMKLNRSFFVENENKEFAHYDSPLPIGHEQTISQPTLVYAMTAELGLSKTYKVLEIGTGSGYQTAFLAEFAGEVYSVERIEDLSLNARKRLEKLGYDNVKFKIGDGSEGWEEFAPYDRIIVTAAAGKVPDKLIEQLKPGGKLLIPVGEKGLQDLIMIKKDKDGRVIEEFIEKVNFVELKGDFGWKH